MNDFYFRYAGWVGTVAARYTSTDGRSLSPPSILEESKHRLAAVAGTSTCHLIQVFIVFIFRKCFFYIIGAAAAQSPQGVFVPGVWGPYRVSINCVCICSVIEIVQDAVFPGWWMNEGGQSSTGQLIDFVLKTHPAYPKLKQTADTKGIVIYDCKPRNDPPSHGLHIFHRPGKRASEADSGEECQLIDEPDKAPSLLSGPSW